MVTKSSIRKEKLYLRGQKQEEERECMSLVIKEHVLELSCIQNAETVLCYAGYLSEVSTTELIKELLFLRKKVYLPKVNGEEMEFYRIEGLKDLTAGYKGIPEPSDACTEIYEINKDSSVVMIMPGCAFALDGSRVGYGKGYYDRYLEKHDIVKRVALCFSVQLTENIPTDSYDKKASLLITEKGIIYCS